MEGNFLSRFNNRVKEWKDLIENEPHNKNRYESEMSQYIIKCMPYMNQHTDETNETNTNNVFNLKETVGLKRKDIFTEYLIEVEKQNIARPLER